MEATPSKTSEKVPFSEESETKSEAQTTSAASIEERINSLLPSEEFGDDAENNFESLFQKMQLFKGMVGCRFLLGNQCVVSPSLSKDGGKILLK